MSDFSTNTDFDVELVKNVLPLFIGTKDFKTFMGKSGTNTEYFIFFFILLIYYKLHVLFMLRKIFVNLTCSSEYGFTKLPLKKKKLIIATKVPS